ncbi:hypothetical protein HYH02_001064 [Chlamydomonas schloesseri]|uniref:GATA-type domain-containing protein n=1 Tax=Chlamydomonas schloesseri TaxID=2026947 RepID=A0A835WVL5_9CHLO|nr:hypothetical protein HYH02_001064 [Chlamydomonas schloesseri]|eukprot:KAG2454023.1 hypothetical protein HYH02_001064 [Chlamydomonas schloesseri]
MRDASTCSVAAPMASGAAGATSVVATEACGAPVVAAGATAAAGAAAGLPTALGPPAAAGSNLGRPSRSAALHARTAIMHQLHRESLPMRKREQEDEAVREFGTGAAGGGVHGEDTAAVAAAGSPAGPKALATANQAAAGPPRGKPPGSGSAAAPAPHKQQQRVAQVGGARAPATASGCPQVKCITCGVMQDQRPRGFFARGTRAYTCPGCCARNRNALGYYGPTGTRSLADAGGRACADCNTEDTPRWYPHYAIRGVYACNACRARYISAASASPAASGSGQTGHVAAGTAPGADAAAPAATGAGAAPSPAPGKAAAAPAAACSAHVDAAIPEAEGEAVGLMVAPKARSGAKTAVAAAGAGQPEEAAGIQKLAAAKAAVAKARARCTGAVGAGVARTQPPLPIEGNAPFLPAPSEGAARLAAPRAPRRQTSRLQQQTAPQPSAAAAGAGASEATAAAEQQPLPQPLPQPPLANAAGSAAAGGAEGSGTATGGTDADVAADKKGLDPNQVKCASCSAAPYARHGKISRGFFTRGTHAYTCHGCCLRNLAKFGFYGPPGTQSFEEAGGRECAGCGTSGSAGAPWRMHPARLGEYACALCRGKVGSRKRKLQAAGAAGAPAAAVCLAAPAAAGGDGGDKRQRQHEAPAGTRGRSPAAAPVPTTALAAPAGLAAKRSAPPQHQQSQPRPRPRRQSTAMAASGAAQRVGSGAASGAAAAGVSEQRPPKKQRLVSGDQLPQPPPPPQQQQQQQQQDRRRPSGGVGSASVQSSGVLQLQPQQAPAVPLQEPVGQRAGLAAAAQTQAAAAAVATANAATDATADDNVASSEAGCGSTWHSGASDAAATVPSGSMTKSSNATGTTTATVVTGVSEWTSPATDAVRCAYCAGRFVRMATGQFGFFEHGTLAYSCHGCCNRNWRSQFGFYGPPGTRSLAEAGGRECAGCGTTAPGTTWKPHKFRLGLYVCKACRCRQDRGTFTEGGDCGGGTGCRGQPPAVAAPRPFAAAGGFARPAQRAQQLLQQQRERVRRERERQRQLQLLTEQQLKEKDDDGDSSELSGDVAGSEDAALEGEQGDEAARSKRQQREQEAAARVQASRALLAASVDACTTAVVALLSADPANARHASNGGSNGRSSDSSSSSSSRLPRPAPPEPQQLAGHVSSWLQAHVCRRPLALLLGPSAEALGLDREQPPPDLTPEEQEAWRGCRASVCGKWLHVARQAMEPVAPVAAASAPCTASKPVAGAAGPATSAGKAREPLPTPVAVLSGSAGAVQRFRAVTLAASSSLASELARWLAVPELPQASPQSAAPFTPAALAPAAGQCTAQRTDVPPRGEQPAPGPAGDGDTAKESVAAGAVEMGDAGSDDGSSSHGQGELRPQSRAGSASGEGGGAEEAGGGSRGADLKAELQPLLLRPVCEALWAGLTEGSAVQ